SGFAVHPDISAALFHNSVHHRKSEPCAFSQLLSSEERFENMRENFFAHPTAGVCYGEQYELSGSRTPVRVNECFVQLRIGRLKCKFSSIRHCIARIYHQIQNYLFDLSWIRLDRAEIGRSDGNDLDVFPNQSLQHFLRIQHQYIQIENPWLQYL